MRALFFPKRPAGFSLIELVVVVAIIGIISAFAIPAATTIVLGSDLSRGEQMLSAQLSLARQMAMTKNHAVEVRFLRFADPDQPGEDPTDGKTWRYRAVSLMEVLPNGNTIALTKPERVPNSVVMNTSKYSSLLSLKGATGQDGGSQEKPEGDQDLLPVQQASNDPSAPSLPRMPSASARKYDYVAFKFLSDGSTDLNPTGRWYVTLMAAKDQAKLSSSSESGDPIQKINYFTLQVDPASGSLRTFRPTVGSATKTAP